MAKKKIGLIRTSQIKNQPIVAKKIPFDVVIESYKAWGGPLDNKVIYFNNDTSEKEFFFFMGNRDVYSPLSGKDQLELANLQHFNLEEEIAKFYSSNIKFIVNRSTAWKKVLHFYKKSEYISADYDKLYEYIGYILATDLLDLF